MANKWNLNDSRQIAYFDADGNKHSAKEVWYIGQYNKYKVWPGSIYLTNVKIEGGGKIFDYSIDNNGVPSYKWGGTTFSGLSPDTDYVIYGTIVVYQSQNGQNQQVASYENCYPWHLTVDEWEGGTSSASPIWSASNGNGQTRPNPILPDDDPQKNWSYNVYRCGQDYASYGSDDNVWFSPHMGFITKWPGDTNGFTTIAKLGERDYGIRLKRAKRTHSFNSGNADSSYLTWTNPTTLIRNISYYTSWDGPEPLSTNVGYTVTSSNSTVLQATVGSTNVTVKYVSEIFDKNENINVTVKSKAVTGLTQQSKTYTFKVYGSTYKAVLNDISNYSNLSKNTVTLTGTHNLTLYKSTDDLYYRDKGGGTATWTEISCTLTSDNSSVASVSGQQVTMRGEGTTNINIKVGGVTVMTIPVKVDAPKEYWFKLDPCRDTSIKPLSGTYSMSITNADVSPYNTYILSVYANSSGTSLASLYYVASGNPPSTLSASGTVSALSMYIPDPDTSREWTMTIYDKQGGTKLGTINIEYK